MLLTTIMAVFVLMGSTSGGHIYTHSNNRFKVQKVEPNFQEIFRQKITNDFVPQDNTESENYYSVPDQNDYDLHQYISNLQSDKLHASEMIADISPPVNHQNDLAINSLLQHNIPTKTIPSPTLTIPVHQERNLPANIRQDINIPVANIPINENSFLEETLHIPTDISFDNIFPQVEQPSHLKLNAEQHISDINLPNVNNFEFTKQQDTYHEGNSGLINELNVQSPKITKHIYFHVPPPEIETPAINTITPKIKKYNIIFIKTPSQERADIARLQQKANNQVAPVEEKAIIYVLSEKSTSQQVSLPKPVPSQHEVFFVNYNDNLSTAISAINDNLEQESEPQLTR